MGSGGCYCWPGIECTALFIQIRHRYHISQDFILFYKKDFNTTSVGKDNTGKKVVLGTHVLARAIATIVRIC